MVKSIDLSGVWHFIYWYPSNDHDGEDLSEYYGQMQQVGKELVFESLPNQEESYMLARLSLDGDLATGTWHETTSPHGPFKGMIYSGAGQLILDKNRKYLSGKWAGAGIDRKTNRSQIYTGRWEIRRAGPKPQAN